MEYRYPFQNSKKRKAPKPNSWGEYERQKVKLPPMPADEYEAALKAICVSLGLDPDKRRNYLGF